jgi:hypothetical protein
MICLGQLVASDWLLRTSRRRAMERATTVSPRLPRLTVVSLVGDDAAGGDVLDRLAAQDHPDTEILVVATSGDPRAGRLERLLAAARPWSADRDRVVAPAGHDSSDLGAALAAVLEASTGDHIVVLPGEAMPAAGALTVLHEIALVSKAGVVSGVPGYAMPTLAAQAVAPADPMRTLGFVPLWATIATRGRHPRLAYAHPSVLVIARDALRDALSAEALPAVGGGRDRAARAIARTVVGTGRRVRLVDAVDLVDVRPPVGVADAIRAWRRTALDDADDSFGQLLGRMLAVSAAWLLPLLVPLIGLVAGDGLLLRGGLVALGALATFRLVLALLDRQPVSAIALHPVTTLAYLAAHVASLVDGVLGRTDQAPARTGRVVEP